jgi:hypothetical protein
MNPRPVILALCCAIAIVVGVYLVGSYYFGQIHKGHKDVPVRDERPLKRPSEIT